MIELAFIVRPLIGAVIGYITNDIAIRMLFRPRTAKYVFGIRIPFTPGLIPKEKSRIASSIGDAISKNLMNRDVLEKTLLSEEMIGKLRAGIEEFVVTQKANSESVREYLSHYLLARELDDVTASVSADLSTHIHTALASAALGKKIAAMAVTHVIEKVSNGVLGIFGADRVIDMVAQPVESLLAKNIDEMLAGHSEEIVGSIITGQIENFMHMPVRDLFIGKDRQIEQAVATIISLYRRLVTEQLPRILDTLDISRIIEARINEMDVRESERLILEVMKKELKAIVWLGALLGFVMGCINLLF